MEKTGINFKWLAVIFAIFGVCVGLFGIGTFTQISWITTAVSNAFDPESKHIAFTLFNNEYTWSVVIAGLLVTFAVALVIIGGLKRISKVAEKVVPAMAVIYALVFQTSPDPIGAKQGAFSYILPAACAVAVAASLADVISKTAQSVSSFYYK